MTQASPSAAPPAVSFREAFLFWLKLGFISFGGPAGQTGITLSRFKRNVIHVIGACALAGLLVRQFAG